MQLVGDAVLDNLLGPSQALDAVRGGANEVRELGGRVLRGVGSLVSTVARGAARPAPVSPLNAEIGAARRFVMVGTDLEDHRRVRAPLGQGAYAEDVSINDVVLATIAGAFRTWLLTRGEPVGPGSVVRAMVPVSIVGTDGEGPGVGHRLTACFVDLPVGEPGASMRLHQVAFAMRQQIEGGQAVGAERLVGLAGSRRRRCTRSAPASGRRCRGACSTSSSPTSPAPSRRSGPGTRRCSRPTPSCRSPAARRWPSA